LAENVENKKRKGDIRAGKIPTFFEKFLKGFFV